MKSSILPIIALLHPTLARQRIAVASRTATQTDEEQQGQRELYTTETIDLEEAQCCTGTSPTELEVEYIYGDDYTNGTNATVSPTEVLVPRPTPLPTEIETPAPTDIETPAPSQHTVTTPSPTDIETPAPTPFPSPNEDDGGLTDDQYISTPAPTKRPTNKPSGKPMGYGYLPTTSYHPTDDTDDWASGWMPTAPSSDDKPLINNDDDTDDWHGGYPVYPTVDSKAGKGSKSSGSKAGKGSRSYVTDDAYRGYGLSKVSSLVNSEVSSAYKGVDVGMGLVGVGAGMIACLYF